MNAGRTVLLQTVPQALDATPSYWTHDSTLPHLWRLCHELELNRVLFTCSLAEVVGSRSLCGTICQSTYQAFQRRLNVSTITWSRLRGLTLSAHKQTTNHDPYGYSKYRPLRTVCRRLKFKFWWYSRGESIPKRSLMLVYQACLSKLRTVFQIFATRFSLCWTFSRIYVVYHVDSSTALPLNCS